MTFITHIRKQGIYHLIKFSQKIIKSVEVMKMNYR